MMINRGHQSDPDKPCLLMERMDVSDVDSFKISGCSSITSTLKNLIPFHPPDLVFHHSSQAVSEYNNPDLMPGMFPTLSFWNWWF